MKDKLQLGQVVTFTYLAIGCVVWFAHFDMGVIKAVVLGLLVILNYKCFNLHSLPGFRFAVSFFLCFSISSYFNGSMDATGGRQSFLFQSVGFLDNYLFFVLGYRYFNNNFISTKGISTTLIITSALCSLTIANFFLGFPDWFCPSIVSSFENSMVNPSFWSVPPLFSTGFGLGRTGWGNSLALLVPLCFFFINNRETTVFGIIVFLFIIGSIIVSGSRGGMLAALCTITIYVYLTHSSGGRVWKIFRWGLVISLLFIIIANGDSVMGYYRLDNEDITTGRLTQLAFFPQMFSEMGLWGLGLNQTFNYLNNFGIEYQLHNTYLRFMLENGIPVFSFFFFLLVKIISMLIKYCRKSTPPLMLSFSLVLVSGLLSGLFEPSAVFGCRSWYVVWWFCFGALYRYTKALKYNDASNSTTDRYFIGDENNNNQQKSVSKETSVN